MKINTLKAAVIGALMVPLTAIHAEEAAPAEDSDFSFSANVGLFSDYIWRGQSQTQSQPAIQGGFDIEHSSGFYAGVWASNVEWTTASGAMEENSVEIDGYAGFSFDIYDVGFDLGVLQYWYPGDEGAGQAQSDATEVYAGISYDFGFLSAGYTAYYLVSDEGWAWADADGTMYHDFSVDIPLGETPITVSAHYGIWDAEGDFESEEWDDWKVNVDYAITENYSLGAFYTDTDNEELLIDGEEVNDETFGAYFSASF
jgi:uncharacterized protein (TIGR02001 family)